MGEVHISPLACMDAGKEREQDAEALRATIPEPVRRKRLNHGLFAAE